MITATADEVRSLMRQGFNTIGVAYLFNTAGLFAANQGRAWRESDVWNLLARDASRGLPPLRETWGYGLRDMTPSHVRTSDMVRR